MKFLPPEDYQQRNLDLFQDLKSRILKELPDARVEHVGASAIPGALSKGDLDIFVGVAAEALDGSIEAIESMGFRVKQDTLRTPELCMLELGTEGPAVAVQLVANGSRFESFIKFRDALIQSPQLLACYNELKKSCAGMNPESYRARKSTFIEGILDEN